MPVKGYVDQIARGGVLGWATDTDLQGQPVSISIFVNGRERGRCIADRHRAGMHDATGGEVPDICEFRFEFDPPLSAFAEHHVRVAVSGATETLADGERSLPRPAHREASGFAPLLLTSTGRSGTTLIMSEFARNPRIVVADHHPYEIKQIAYYAAAFRALVADADRARSTDPVAMLAPENSRRVGSNPYNDPGLFALVQPPSRLREYFECDVPSRFATLFSDLIVRYYEILRSS